MPDQLHHILQQSARSYGNHVALTYSDTSFTYAELELASAQARAGLLRLRLSPGDRVAIFLEKRIETVVSCFAASAAGGIFVPINPLLRPKQVAHILDNCSVRVLITSASRLESLRTELEHSQHPKIIVIVDGPDQVTRLPGREPIIWSHLLDNAESDAFRPAAKRIDLDVAAILYTSGSTGKPKGVMLSHRNLIAGAESVNHYLEHRESDVILAALPLSFDAGLSQITTGFGVGAHVILHNYLFAKDVIRLCARHRVTGMTGVPPLWLQLAEKPWPAEATESVRYFANTGGRMPRATLQKLRGIFTRAKPYLMYGLTEAFRSTYLDPAEVDRRPDSIGKAIPNAEILVVRPDGSRCAAGEPGELVHRGALVALGYWGDPEKTAERFRPAPHRNPARCLPEIAVWSGDVVKQDDDGFLYFIGRRDEMIKTSGYRVSPVEIEEAVQSTGLVRDAVAVGMADAALGQHIVLLVSPPEGAEIDEFEILEALKPDLPLYMLPRSIIVRSSLPRSPNGKFDRARIRDELIAHYEAEHSGSSTDDD